MNDLVYLGIEMGAIGIFIVGAILYTNWESTNSSIFFKRKKKNK